MSRNVYKKFAPTPEGLLEHINHGLGFDNAECLKEVLWLIKHRYFRVCETCNTSGKVTYFSSAEADQDIELLTGSAQIEDCPDCEGKGFNFPWEIGFSWTEDED